MKVENLNREFDFKIKSKNETVTRYELDFGTLSQGGPSNFELVFISPDKILDFRARPSCGGCTTVKTKKLEDNTYKIIVQYDSVILGNINKSVNVTYVTEHGAKHIHIQMRGLIKR